MTHDDLRICMPGLDALNGTRESGCLKPAYIAYHFDTMEWSVALVSTANDDVVEHGVPGGYTFTGYEQLRAFVTERKSLYNPVNLVEKDMPNATAAPVKDVRNGTMALPGTQAGDGAKTRNHRR